MTGAKSGAKSGANLETEASREQLHYKATLEEVHLKAGDAGCIFGFLKTGKLNFGGNWISPQR